MKRIILERPDAPLVGTTVGHGPCVLLLHAGGERRAIWEPVAEQLAAGGFESVAYDLRGHGESGTAGAEQLSTHADDVAAMVSARPDPVALVGASLGGLAALAALRQPAVRRMVYGVALVDVVPYFDPDRVRAYLNGVGDGLADSPLVADVLARRTALAAAAGWLHDLPTLLLRGDDSQLTDRFCQRFTDDVPNAIVETVAGAGHLVAKDAPSELASLLMRFLVSSPVRHRIERLALIEGHPRLPVDALAERRQRTMS